MTGPLYNVAIASRINRVHGGAVIAAWELEELDESNYNLFTQWSMQEPRNAEGLQRIEAVKAEIRRQFLH